MRRYLFEAEYTDGFVYRATQRDESIYEPKRNAYFDVMNKLAADHGRLTRWTLLPQGGTVRLDIDFTRLPENTKPIWYIKRQRDRTVQRVNDTDVVISDTIFELCYGFGYEYTDEAGNIVKEVREVT